MRVLGFRVVDFRVWVVVFGVSGFGVWGFGGFRGFRGLGFLEPWVLGFWGCRVLGFKVAAFTLLRVVRAQGHP